MNWFTIRDGARERARSARSAAQAQKQAAKEADKRREEEQRHRALHMRIQRNADAIREQQAGAAHYAQLILLLGFGGLFTLWIQTRGEMSPWLWASTGSLITLSLLLFVGFELAKTYVLGRVQGQIEAGRLSPYDGQLKVDAVNRWWILTFSLSTGSGLLAGFSILFWFVYRAWLAAMTLAA